MANEFLNIPVLAGNGPGAPVDVSGMGFLKLFSLTGVFEATINIEISNDGVAWATITSLTAPNDAKKLFAAMFVRSNVAGYVAGAPTLAVGSEAEGGASLMLLPVPAGNGTGASVDVSALGEQKTLIYNGGMEASLTVEISQDGVTYAGAASFAGPTPASVNICGAVKRMRVVVGGFAIGVGTVSVAATQAGGGAGATQSILWDSLGGGDATTWAEVMAFVAASLAPITIYVNNDATIPVGTYEINGATFVADPIIASKTITLADGAVLNNLGKIYGQLVLRGTQTGGPCLTFDAASGGSPNILILEFNGVLQNDGTGPMIEVPAGAFFVVSFVSNGTYLSGGGQPHVNLGAAAVFIIGSFGISSLTNDFLTGPAGSSLFYQNLGGFPSPLPTNAGFLGTTVQNILFGVSCLNVANRPFNPFGGPILIGTMVFDQSLGVTGMPIWWDGTQWVDATGAPA